MSVIDIVKKQERELGLSEGLQKGRLEERVKSERLLQEERVRAEAEKLADKREIARAMKKDGLPLEQIAKFTRLSMQDIEKL